MLNTLKQLWQIPTPFDKPRLLLLLTFGTAMTLFEYGSVMLFLISLIAVQINIWIDKDDKYISPC